MHKESKAMPDNFETNYKLGQTARWTAAVRAVENSREDRLFADPWADSLAGQEGRDWIEGRSMDSLAPMILRTRFFDDFLEHITRENQIDQIILVAAGLDTRAFRLSWPRHTKIYELDQASVLEEKEDILSSVDARSNCERRAVNVDLAGSWSDSLISAGFKPEQPSVWLLEGFLFYIPDETIIELFSKLSQLAVSGSWLGFDIVNRISLTHPLTQPWVEMQAKGGAPWIGSMDDPIGFLTAQGWKATLTQAGQLDANHGRWPFPVIPTMMPDMPHNWFVTAEKV
jgi:methyltransferase (TIGR00027 family)